MIAHQAEREIGAVGQPVHIPLLDLQRLAQVGEVRRIFTGVERAQVDALRDEAIAARFGRGHVLGLDGRRIGRQSDRRGKSPVDFGTRQIGHGVGNPALVHDDEVAILVEADR